MAKQPDQPPPSKAEGIDPKTEIVEQLTPLLRPERKGEAIRIVETMVAKFHQGPLPPPEDLQGYDVICPGAAERILVMAERSQDHREAMERSWLNGSFGLQRTGQWLAISALAMMLILIGFTFYIGQPIAGSILGGATLVAIVSMFLSSNRLAPEETPAARPPKTAAGKKRRR